jgi:ribosomal protein S18 acetylase RimI-like enzyme
MKTEIRRVILPRELRSLQAFDRKVFSEADCFPAEYWSTLESYWLLVDGRKAGCCAFEKHVDFQEDLREDGRNVRRHGSLYIATTGIAPAFQGQGWGRLLKSWELAYARHNGFRRVITNARKSNAAMIALNRRFGFRVIRTTRGYYADPTESTVVMALEDPPLSK